MVNNEKSLTEMIEEMTQYYEAAGFSGIYERQYKCRSEEETRRMYQEFQKECYRLAKRQEYKNDSPPF